MQKEARLRLNDILANHSSSTSIKSTTVDLEFARVSRWWSPNDAAVTLWSLLSSLNLLALGGFAIIEFSLGTVNLVVISAGIDCLREFSLSCVSRIAWPSNTCCFTRRLRARKTPRIKHEKRMNTQRSEFQTMYHFALQHP